MLAQELRSLHVWFETLRQGAHELTAEGAKHFSDVLASCVAQAEELEGRPIRGALTGNPETDKLLRTARVLAGVANVVMLHAARPTGGRPFGGDAA